MISEKWRTRMRLAGRILLYVGIAIYLLAIYEKLDSIDSNLSNLDSIQSDVSSMQSDLSGIEDGSCSNNHICP
jgi:hypothetical protein